ncbi:MAG: beta-galactosidase trimerization domain-containing protein, partial [Parasporobacterium sp.]|nr:beta-galactosidase trimerization domain-containing protein [Parasporobacterium sp.]
AGGWEITTHANDPGQLAVWAFQAIAHGADCIVFFRWRTCCFGTEQFWHGILPHSGIPGRIYEEAKSFISMMSPYMDEIEGSMPKPEVAIVHSYRQNYALDIQPQHPELEYRNQLYKYYRGFYDKQIPVDFVSPMDDYTGYKLIVAPLQYLMNPELEQHYMDYVKNGGHLILTMRCGVKDENNICMSDYPLPGRLSEACGITVPEYDCLFGKECTVTFERKEYKVEKWADIIKLNTAEPIGSYADNYYKGYPAITKNRYGKGTVWYVGCEPSDSLMSALIASIAWDCELRSLGTAEPEVELATRTKNGKTFLFVINHSDQTKHYKLHQAYTRLEGIEEGKLKPYEIQLFVKQN